ncbi:MAG: hypothetical protein ACOZIN_03810 [Myxococcota bacterium]
MSAKILTVVLAMFSLTGCIIVSGGGGKQPPPPPLQPGNVTFTWSFAGQTCNDVPQVAKVQVVIPGETLQNNGVYPCLANNYPGIVLHNFAGKTYSFEINALGYGDEVLYTHAGTYTVNGDVRVTVDLTPVGGPNSYAYLTWKFPPNSLSQNPTCQQVGVAFVDVNIDGTTTRYPCEQGQTTPGAQTPFIAAGTHSVAFVAVDANDYPYYRFSGSLQTFAGNPVSSDYQLAWGVGGVALGWQLTDGSLAQNCASAGVTTMSINFEDAQGNLIYGQNGDPAACNAAPVVYSFLQPGTYRVFIKGTGPGNVLYLSNGTNPPVVTVTAGQFPTAQQAISVQLYRQ